ncbi:hypothetical protein Plhal304r1_c057g0143081 [Plasmopara halstedii]
MATHYTRKRLQIQIVLYVRLLMPGDDSTFASHSNATRSIQDEAFLKFPRSELRFAGR